MLENMLAGCLQAFIFVLMSDVEGTYFWKAELLDGLMREGLAPKSSSCIWSAADW